MASVDACKCVHGADRGHTGTRTSRECAVAPDKTGIFVRHWKLQKASSPFLFVVVQEKNWCGRWESNPHEEKSPEDFHAVYGFRRPDGAFWSAHVRFAVWTIPSPSPGRSGA